MYRKSTLKYKVQLIKPSTTVHWSTECCLFSHPGHVNQLDIYVAVYWLNLEPTLAIGKVL